MKKLLFILFFCGIGSTYAQQVSTSEEEYNYLTKGYKIQLESGLDMKQGYILKTFSKSKVDAYNFEFSFLQKISGTKNTAILILAKSNVSGLTYYFCIPFNNQKLLEQYYYSVSSLDERMTTALQIATSKALADDVEKWN